ncbi:uncharacterized protein L969DRAFT_105494 [Mixia osmundae IAM 14324]|uniref:Very long-chain fatty acid transport protein n=1 Tax=Mixia osmundae (strain CBS 9802 / IAM 14324 / JCM 22182 / KY 12970) TaxID=764103 RepID=G7E259_MIXOS|nr:uncharacterized protein L969DRAFT_105494 [Mixia osmundae IAM 14324]KEI36791.1 hypothetical protein L969DRAFT_105494 [Mixia osmundae IAM 14324]GAA96919.1 hypothetical protein E5Q_03593 [Mixia osmundae IAM 14324]
MAQVNPSTLPFLSSSEGKDVGQALRTDIKAPLAASVARTELADDLSVDSMVPSDSEAEAKRRTARTARKPLPVPVPDFRFEQGYLLSIAPYVKPAKRSSTEPLQGEPVKIDSEEDAALASTGDMFAQPVIVDWAKIAYLTLRDQMIWPFLTAIAWSSATFMLSDYQAYRPASASSSTRDDDHSISQCNAYNGAVHLVSLHNDRPISSCQREMRRKRARSSRSKRRQATSGSLPSYKARGRSIMSMTRYHRYYHLQRKFTPDYIFPLAAKKIKMQPFDASRILGAINISCRALASTLASDRQMQMHGSLELAAASTADPFQAYLAAFEPLLFPKPSPGFEGRLWALAALSGGHIIVTTLYMLVWAMGNRTHFIRRVIRPDGSFWIINPLWGSTFEIMSGAVIIFSCVQYHRAYILRDINALGSVISLHALTWAPLWLAFWSHLIANIQALSIMSAKTPVIRPHLLNCIAIITPIIIFGPLLTISLVADHKWSQILNIIRPLRSQLQSDSIAFQANPATAVAALQALAPSLLLVQKLNRQLLVLGKAIAAVWIVKIKIALAANVFNCVLLKRLSESLKFTRRRDLVPVEECAPTDKTKWSSQPESTFSVPAHTRTTSLQTIERLGYVHRLEALRSVIAVVFFVGAVVCTISLTIALITAFDTSRVMTDWALVELASTGISWGNTVLIIPAKSAQIYQALRHRKEYQRAVRQQAATSDSFETKLTLDLAQASMSGNASGHDGTKRNSTVSGLNILYDETTSRTMRYLSTRGAPERLTFEETVLTGLAPDGGLFIPAELPTLPKDWATTWSKLTFQELAYQVYSLYIDPKEISQSELEGLIAKSYATFRHDQVAPLHEINEHLYILELFHGPTFAFKDVALQFLGNLFEFFLARKNKGKQAAERSRLTVVGATSGDTGSAAIYGLRNKQDVSIFILHPKGRVSPIQEAQMTTVTDANVFNLAVKGTFDDCQDIVKACFAQKDFNAKYHLGAVNSINWARILAQIVYYFSSYFALLKRLGIDPASPEAKEVKVQYAVPTGNFGDILAGYYAKSIGLPIDQLIIATNENDILERFWRTGRYEKADPTATASKDNSKQTEAVNGSTDGAQATQSASGESVKETLAPAMDILVSSNFERLLWYLAHECLTTSAQSNGHTRDDERIRKAGEIVSGWMSDLKTKGKAVMGDKVLRAAQRDFCAERVSDEQTIQTVKTFFTADKSYVVDPHTAIGLEAAQRLAKQNATKTYQIALATAHPAKFSSAVSLSLKDHPSFDFERDVLPDEFVGLLDKERKVIDVPGTDPKLTQEVVAREVAKLYGQPAAGDDAASAKANNMQATAIKAAAGILGWMYLDAQHGISADRAKGAGLIAGSLSLKRNDRADENSLYYKFEKSVKKSPDAVCYICDGKSLTWKEVEDKAHQVGHFFLSKGIKRKDVVAIYMPNKPAYPILWLGLMYIDAVPAFINYNLTGEGLVHCISVADAKFVVFEHDLESSIADIESVLASKNAEARLLRWDDEWSEGLHNSSMPTCKNAETVDAKIINNMSTQPLPHVGHRDKIGFQDPCCLVYTSGTTGLPKAASCSHGRIGFASIMWGWVNHIKTGDRIYTPMPLYHSTASFLAIAMSWAARSSVVIGRRFSATRFWDEVRASDATVIQYVGEVCRYLLAVPPQPNDKDHKVRLAYGNGMRKEVYARFKERFGVKAISEFFASTEGNGSLFNYNTGPFGEGAVGRDGTIASFTRRKDQCIIKIDPLTEEPYRDPKGRCVRADVNEPGELITMIDKTSAFKNFTGYHGNEAATKKKILSDVFAPGDLYFRTGDLLRKDADGFSFFGDRLGDTFRWKSENVSTEQVATALNEVVEEANVYGVELPGHDGRAGCAAVPATNMIDYDKVARHVAARLPKYAQPLFIRIVPKMETTGTAKQVKVALRNEGVDPLKVQDPVYWLKGTTYVPFSRDDWAAIKAGKVKL